MRRQQVGRVARWLGVLSALAAAAAAQETTTTRVIDEEGTIVEVEEPVQEEAPTEARIGMEAYHRILASGEYLVGPGDEFLISLSDKLSPVEVPVLAEGGLFIPRVGRVHVGGRRLREARAAIDSAYHASVRVGTIAVELSSLRQFPLSVTGLVAQPGVTVANGVQRVSEVVRKVGGVDARGSTRNIRLIRTVEMSLDERWAAHARAQAGDLSLLAEVPSLRVDLDMYRLRGRVEDNPFVEDGDIIVVPARRPIVRALEAWQRYGNYEFVPGDRIRDLATLAMGPSPNHDPQNVYLFRYVDEGRRQVHQRVDLAAAMADDRVANLELEAGDWLVARPLPDFQKATTVQIVGEVAYPGFYLVDPNGTPLKEVVERAGGFTPEAALAQARMVRQLTTEDTRDPEFERIVTIPASEWDREERQYFTMRSRERVGQMVVDFVALFRDGDLSQNLLVRPDDVIIVPASKRTVVVSGPAVQPGAVPYDSSYTVFDYIERAGGFGWRASKDVTVIRARTGERMKAEDLARPEPGDRIWIKEKPERNYWAAFLQGIEVAGQVATVVLLFVTIGR